MPYHAVLLKFFQQNRILFSFNIVSHAINDGTHRRLCRKKTSITRPKIRKRRRLSFRR